MCIRDRYKRKRGSRIITYTALVWVYLLDLLNRGVRLEIKALCVSQMNSNDPCQCPHYRTRQVAYAQLTFGSAFSVKNGLYALCWVSCAELRVRNLELWSHDDSVLTTQIKQSLPLSTLEQNNNNHNKILEIKRLNSNAVSNQRQPCFTHMIVYAHAHTPVSYTHLDVYKRQEDEFW